MELSINDSNTKALITSAIVELLSTNKEILHNAILEVIEDIGLANAMVVAETDVLVAEEDVFKILDGNPQ